MEYATARLARDEERAPARRAAFDAPFAALEPWLGHATATDEDDVFEHKRDTVLLAPGAVDERSFTLTVF